MADRPARAWPALDLDGRPGVDLEPGFDDRLAVVIDDLGVTAVEGEAGAHWRLHFDAAATRDAAGDALGRALGAWLDVATVEVADDDWARKVQAGLGAVRVGRIVVAPPWDVEKGPERSSEEEPPGQGSAPHVTIIIEPSTGFGTGHHQSTRLCLAALQALDLQGRRVVDAGTGSGILALSAVRLGASDVVGIDVDEDAVASAHRNAELNALAGRLTLLVADLGAIGLAPADVVTANLTAGLLRQRAATLAGLVTRGGVLIASGFTRDQVPLVLEAFADLVLAGRNDEDDWVALAFRRP